MEDLFGTPTDKGATFSPCRTWRYTLWRQWEDGPTVMFIGLNPSTADEMNDDPTIRRCIRFAQNWGFGRYLMTNLFAYRATDPKVMKAYPEPIGPENDKVLVEQASQAKLVIASWGVHGVFNNRAALVLKMLPPVHCLGITKDGFPKHPLYLKGDSKPELYNHRG